LDLGTSHPKKSFNVRLRDVLNFHVGKLKKNASGVLALSPCSRTESTLRAPKRLRSFLRQGSGHAFFEHFLLSVAVGGISGMSGLWTCSYSTGARTSFSEAILKRMSVRWISFF